ncbi:MAG: DUF4422 domain-containing protein [Lachnospiraceae bacterium]|nr:DUF4422 domain-containing protein [Lachnospiraceae bacterium]
MVKIFTMTHKEFDVPNDPMYVPLHVGHAGAKKDFGYMGDDTGDNISDLNCYYAELSGVYWVWKNYHQADYVGICHYRRFLTDENGYAFTEREYEDILKKYDIITTKQLELPNSYRFGFGAHHNVNTLDETGKIIKEHYPQFYDTYVTLVNENRTYFGNIMVAKKALYDEYCEWLFGIFFELQRRIDLTFEDDYHKRVFGFISEFLLYVWVTAKKLSAYECKVAIIGEKKETGEIKEQMQLFFEKRDMVGAKEYFLQYLKKRPDVIMEASDVTGECKLCLQAVSTANLEQAEYGSSFLDRINDYDTIIKYFRQLNKAAAQFVKEAVGGRALTNVPKAEYVQTIEADDYDQSTISDSSDIALRAAIKLYAPDHETAQTAFEQIKAYQKKQMRE